ncbi:MAG: choice-of-anchor D domain-containing protein [Ardenticatenaceae bacterium]|nr:choice-of-anchor D domain-containing protein [Ardenticatenaceae bacterium]
MIKRPFFVFPLLGLALLLLVSPAASTNHAMPLQQPDQQPKGRLTADLLALAEHGTLADSDQPNLMLFDENRVAVRITAADVDHLLPILERSGFTLLGSDPDAFLLEGFFPVERLSILETLVPEGLLGVMPVYAPMTAGGSVTSEADFVHEADRVRQTTPNFYDGSGITIGILSDSYNSNGGAAAGINSGDLPAVMTIIEDASGSDEGRAMVELAYDLAPGASYAFATAIGGELNFADNIRNLAGSGPDIIQAEADIIVDDVAYFTEPFFQDGVVSQAINDVVNFDEVAYFSSAGNQASMAYESTLFTPTFDGGTGLVFHDFDPSGVVDIAQRVTIGNGQTIQLVLQWDDPFYTTSGVDTDLDLYLFDTSGNVVAASQFPNIAIQGPFEILSFTNNGVTAGFDIAIVLDIGPAPGRIKYINFGSDIFINEHDTQSPTVSSHAAAAGAQAVAAAFYADQLNPESFTSKGPSTILFTANGMRLGSPDVRNTPDLTAIDGTNTTFFGSDVEGDGRPNFFGTSAAAPHAAAVAALVRQANPTFTPNQVYDRLASTATDIVSSGVGFDNLTGAGLINAYDAIFPIQAAQPQAFFEENFESGVLSNAWETRSTGPGRIRLNTENNPAAGAYHLTMDRFPISTLETPSILFGLNELILHLDLSATTPATLTFDVREFFDEDDPMSATFSGSENSDGVALSVDGGANWYRLISLTGSNATDTYQTHTFDLSQFASNNALVLGSDVRIKFQQYDNFPLVTNPIPGNTDGMGFDNIRILTELPEIAVSSSVIDIENGDTVAYAFAEVGTSITKTFTIENAGLGQTLTVNNLTVGGQFSIEENLGSNALAGGESTTFSIRFTPTILGSQSQTLSLTTNDGDENPFQITLVGYGGRPLYLPFVEKN